MQTITLKLNTITQPSTQTPHYSIIWLHGLGANAHDFEHIAKDLTIDTASTRFIFPNAPVQPITINGGAPCQAWYDIYSLSDLNHEDEKGIAQSQQLIETLINNEIQQGIPSQSIFLAGFSQGGAMALHCGLRHASTLGGIIALSTYLPLANKIASETNSANKNTPIFLAQGQFDPVVPPFLTQYTHNTLKTLNNRTTYHNYPMAHSVCPEELLDISNWLTTLMQS